ncbi:reverse transcriptase domain-containing protein [Tanacetum coccineum]|uniref:Reverse transcriptase domain-containing protein n=1 Tax=Tanacetum coccineum TaxID=301880 RepID=A0ABQ5D202_9ASTR
MVRALFSTSRLSNSSSRSRKSGIEQSCVTCRYGAHFISYCPAIRYSNNYEINIQDTSRKLAAAKFYTKEILVTDPPRWQNQIRTTGFMPMPHNNSQHQNRWNQNQNRREWLKPGVKSNDPRIQQTKPQCINSGLFNTSLPSSSHQASECVKKDFEKLCQGNDAAKETLLALKFMENFREFNFELSLRHALLHMPKFASMFRKLMNISEQDLWNYQNTGNENCSGSHSTRHFPKKLGGLTGRFLIPCDFPELDECLALADLGASINLMPLSVFEKLNRQGLTKTRMVLELADRSISTPTGIAEDVFVKVGTFYFPADFVVVDYDADPRVPLILGRPFLRTARALIDVHGEEMTLRHDDQSVTFKVGDTKNFSYNAMESVNKVDFIDIACEEYSQEVLGFSEVLTNGNSTPYFEPIVDTTSPTLTPFEGSDFILEEIEAELSDTSYKSGIDDAECDPEKDILLLEAILNSEPLSPLPNHANFPEVRKELKICETKTNETSIDEPPEVELKDLPPHLEYAFLEGDNKLPVIIAKDLSVGEKAALIKVLQSHKRAIAWKLSDIKGINPEFCTHKILMEEDYTPAVQHQRRVNPKIHDVIKNEVEKLLDAGLIYPISDSPWVSPVHCVPKKGGFTVVENEQNELIPTRLVTGWRGPKLERLGETNTIVSRMVSQVLGKRHEKSFQTYTLCEQNNDEAESRYTQSEIRNVGSSNIFFARKILRRDCPMGLLTSRVRTLSSIAALDSNTPWFADIPNYHAGNFVIKGMSTQQKRKFFKDVKHYFWEDPFMFNNLVRKISQRDGDAPKFPSKFVIIFVSGELTLWGHSYHPKATYTSLCGC